MQKDCVHFSQKNEKYPSGLKILLQATSEYHQKPARKRSEGHCPVNLYRLAPKLNQLKRCQWRTHTSINRTSLSSSLVPPVQGKVPSSMPSAKRMKRYNSLYLQQHVSHVPVK